MIKRPDTNAQRIKRHKRVRAKISGTPERPRLNVFRSEKNIYAQVIDDVAGNTLVIYDPEIGDPDNGVAPGTPWEEVPEDWVCPLCGVGKDQFSAEE